HTRMTSRGAKNLDNIHPFLINLGPPMNKKAWFCHNGTISSVGKIKDKEGEWSDTRTFAKMLNSLPWEIIKMNLEDNPNETFVLLNQDGEFMKFQERVYDGKRIVDTEGPIEHSPTRIVNNSNISYGYNSSVCDHYRDDYYKNGRNIFPYSSSNNSGKKENTNINHSNVNNKNGIDDDYNWHDALY
ncbi:hypothetical protein M0R36_11120, partial [bacterium]|nr:hypothetical protein [bacterium]